LKQHQALRTPRSSRIFSGVALTALALGMSGALPANKAWAEPAPVAGDAATMRDGIRERGTGRLEERAKERPPVDKHLTSEQVRDIVAGRIAMGGNPNLKVGKVTAKADGIVAVDVVTKSGALVETREISTKTGLPAKLEKAMAEHRGFGRGHAGMREHAMGHRGGHRGEKGSMHRGGAKRDLALTLEQAKKLAEARLIMMGNPNLKVGAVKEKDADTISVDIVAADNSLVSQHTINRHTGRRQRS